MGGGKSINRVDAYEKVTGRAQYTDDMTPKGALVAMVVHSEIANGLVTDINLDDALAVPGVVKIVTCFDVPEIDFPTAGHPWSTEKSHQDVADRRLLNRRVRCHGDDIAAIVAEDMVAAARAARLLRITYDEYPVLLTPEDAMAEGATQLHEFAPGNVLRRSTWRDGDIDFDDIKDPDTTSLKKTYHLQTVQHCHIEPPVSYAYMEKGRVVIVSSTQIPTIVRRVVGQALGMPWGKIRIIKPYIGGGFGNKQDVLYEPLNAFLTMQVGGRPVKLELTREETMACTRVRHAMDMTVESVVRADGRFIARRLTGFSNQGAYASHGHGIIANASSAFRHLYNQEKCVQTDVTTVYTNITTGGAMRGYGIPQACFAMEAHVDDVAHAIGMDPLELRRLNMMRLGYSDPMNGITCFSTGLAECLDKGEKYIGWAEKRAAYQNQTGDIRRGVGMAMFSYKTGTHPIGLEAASCRMTLNEDGSVQLQVGATEIGQGADTVFAQMAAESLDIPVENIHITSTQDTDITPYDTGAYASRQTYVTGKAIKQTGEMLREKILDYAAEMLGMPADELSIYEGTVVDGRRKPLLSLQDLATEAIYSLKHAIHIAAESTFHCKENTFAFGCCFAEIEVDIPLGKIKVLNIINAHDSGVLINPKLAEAQVHGGMSMGLGYGLSEQLLYDKKGKPLNDNLLDYKLMTSLDTPELNVAFVETVDPTGPYGNKALGEPPALPPAPAIRNALLHATGVAVDSLPLSPQRLVEHFKAAGLIE